MTSVPVQVVEFDHVSLAFDDHDVLRDLTFSVGAGELAVLLGASGAGKSVILKLILDLRHPTRRRPTEAAFDA